MKKALVSGYIGFDNFGDEAIASVLTSYLKNINAEKIPLRILFNAFAPKEIRNAYNYRIWMQG